HRTAAALAQHNSTHATRRRPPPRLNISRLQTFGSPRTPARRPCSERVLCDRFSNTAARSGRAGALAAGGRCGPSVVEDLQDGRGSVPDLVLAGYYDRVAQRGRAPVSKLRFLLYVVR